MGMKVQIRGTGLIGTSLGIALSRRGYAVTLSDPSPTAARLARDLGAGALVTGGGDEPDLIVVAAPPDVAGAVVQCALADHSSSVVTDVASVKGVILTHLIDVGADLSRYVGGHPMAGRERSGAMHARGDLFEGRAWVIVPTDVSRTSATDLVQQIARDAGSVTMVMAASEHDKAVATVSHVPQIVSSLVAAQLRLIDQDAVALAGQGLRDVTRIAASDPRLWTQILAGNAEAVGGVLRRVHGELGELIEALHGLMPESDGLGSLDVVARALTAGNSGHALIPGKHGAAPAAYDSVTALVPDTPGELARLLTDVGEAGVNLEDLRLDHGLGQPFGLAEILVVPAAAERLRRALERQGWRVLE